MLTHSPSLHLCFRHPLAKAVLLLCKAVQLSLSPLKGEGAMSCLSHCDRASSYMSSSVAIPLTQSGNLLNKVLLKKIKINKNTDSLVLRFLNDVVYTWRIQSLIMRMYIDIKGMHALVEGQKSC